MEPGGSSRTRGRSHHRNNPLQGNQVSNLILGKGSLESRKEKTKQNLEQLRESRRM